MDAPKAFRTRLEREFQGRLRCRWSPRRSVWVIEEKVGRAALPPVRVAEEDDGMVRARDGYALVLTVTPGDRQPCPACGLTLKVPHLEFSEVECPRCKAERAPRVGRVRAAYFPLDPGSCLLDYLHRIDPLRGGGIEALKAADQAAERFQRDRDARFQDGLNQTLFDAAIHQIPKVGYTTSRQFT